MRDREPGLAIGAVALVGLAAVAAAAALREGDRLSPVIPPGREAQVLELLEPLLTRGFLGRPAGDVRIEGPEIRVQLEAGTRGSGACDGAPAWVRPPGGLAVARGPGDGRRFAVARGGLRLSWHLCGAAPGEAERARSEAAGLVARLATPDVGAVWGPPGGHIGLLTPVSAATGLGPGQALAAAWLIALALTLVAALLVAREPRPAAGTPAPAPRRSRALAGVVLCAVVGAGVAARLHAASAATPDGDEVWARSRSVPVFNGDHDAWVHPPLYRVLQSRWLDAVAPGSGASSPAPLALARAVSTAAGIAALVLLAAAAWRGPWWRALLLGPVAVAPAVVSDSVLARPYALTALLLTATWGALAACPGGGGHAAALRWLVALVAAGLTAWCDLVGGLAAVALVGAGALGPAGPRSRWARVAVLAAMLAWVAALAPGGLEAVHGQVVPPGSTPGHGPDLSPGRGLGGGSALARLGALLGFAVAGVAIESPAVLGPGLLALGALIAGSLRSRRWAGAALALGVLGLGGVGALVSLRTRNVLFLPYLTAFALLELRRDLPERLAARAHALLGRANGVKWSRTDDER